MKIVVVCEARGDFELVACLVRRSLREHGPRWFEDLPEVPRFTDWNDGEDPGFVKWTNIEREYRFRFGRPLQGRNTGPYALPALQAILLANRHTELDGIVLMVDLDRERERRDTFLQIREEASNLEFEILVATPDPEREAWILHGFEPRNPQEEKRLAKLRSQLGFDPRLQPHRLRDDARRAETQRDIKRVLDQLVDGDREREPHCWEMAPLDLLEARGGETFLRHFLVEIRERLLPKLVGGAST